VSLNSFTQVRAKFAWLSSKRARISLLGAASLIIGLVAALAASRHINAELELQKAKLNPKTVTVEVIVPRQNMARGALITLDSVAVRAVPRDLIGDRVILPETVDQVVGSRLAQPIKGGEPLQAYAIEGGEITTFAARVKTGIRAVTISVDDVSSVSGMIQPGDQIDLLWSVKPSAIAQNNATQLEKTVVFMQGLVVMATGKQLRPVLDEGRNRGYSTLTVEATPHQAQRLIVAQRTGKLTAVLRNPNDQNALSSVAIDLSKLLDLQKPNESKGATTELIIGGLGTLQKQKELNGI
jgi:pilus assembly protein CpaB